MSDRILTNFYGLQALVLHPEDASRDTLVRTLRRLGLSVSVADPEEHRPELPEDHQILFFDASRTHEFLSSTECPSVAIIESEVPSRLARVVRQRCCGYLMKPIRATGVFATLVIACNEFALRQREAAERASLAARLAGRRHLIKALVRLMAEEGISDDEAFSHLRRQAMQRRMSVEAVAAELIEGKPNQSSTVQSVENKNSARRYRG